VDEAEVELEARVDSWARGKEVQHVMNHQRNRIQMRQTIEAKAEETVKSDKRNLHECYTCYINS
jgi:hypothetical protein